jgi:hypothetical protein
MYSTETTNGTIDTSHGILTNADLELVNHVTRWGSEGYPIQKVGHGWHWIDSHGVKGPPTVFKSKGAATEAFEGWMELKRRQIGEVRQRQARIKVVRQAIDAGCKHFSRAGMPADDVAALLARPDSHASSSVTVFILDLYIEACDFLGIPAVGA